MSAINTAHNFRTASTDCLAFFHLTGNGERLWVSTFNMRHNHGRDAIIPKQKLTQEEEAQLDDLLAYEASTSGIRSYIYDHFGKILSGQDIRNIRRDRMPAMSGWSLCSL